MPGEHLDRNLEWIRDGQYYHYLTKWMHALNRVSQITRDITYNQWATELAKTSHVAFTYVSPFSGRKSMYWKMNIDLSRPLISSMGQHDPLDGFLTYNQLQAVAFKYNECSDLKTQIADMARICEQIEWVTDDPLGIGGLLCNAHKVSLLILNRYWNRTSLIVDLLRSSQTGLKSYFNRKPMQLPVDCRLAFRELGLTIGLHAVERLQELIFEKQDLFDNGQDLFLLIKSLRQYIPLIHEIEDFWLEPVNRQTKSWKEHLDINMVMLATSLAPEGYLG